MATADNQRLLSTSGWRILILAVILGGMGILLLSLYTQSRTKKLAMVSIAVATQTIPSGTVIQAGMLTSQQIPKGTIAGNFVRGEDIIAVQGRTVTVELEKGQPLYWNSIALLASGGYDRYLRPENRERAFALAFSSPLSNAVKPGDVIDILGTYTEGSNRQAFEVLPAVTVIDKIGTALVLNVTAEEELLLLAAQPCNLTLSVRSKQEPKEDLKLKPVRLNDVIPKAKQLSAVRRARVEKVQEVVVPQAPATPPTTIRRD